MEEEESEADENWREKLQKLVEKSVQELKQLQSSVRCLQLNPTDQDDIIVTLQVALITIYMQQNGAILLSVNYTYL